MRPAGWLLVVGMLLSEVRAEPAWIVDPAGIGPNLPEAGQSLFDEMLADGKGGHRLPFPFESLIRLIEKRAGCAPSACTRAVFIPLGRSLQRTSAAPEFFQFPRVVVAVTTEAEKGAPIKDRLYLGYLEKTGIIEVISYNDSAGRFEFQLVRNYRAGTAPEVVYANRTVCLTCHQNHAPIFSRQVWDETQANPHVRSRLLAARAALHGQPMGSGIDVPAAIDAAVARANELGVTRALWQRGCGESDPCRRAALMNALRYRLTGERVINTDDADYLRDLVAPLASNAGRLWPQGIALPNAGIPNRDPLQDGVITTGVALSHVRAGLEPLAPRPPAEVLPADGRVLARRLVAGVAQWLANEDVSSIERALRAIQGAATTSLTAPCSERRRRWQCDSRALSLAVRLDPGRATLEWLQVEGTPRLNHFELRANGGRRATLTPAGRTLRLVDGNRVTGIEIDRQRKQVRLTVRADFTRWMTKVQNPSRQLTHSGVRNALGLPMHASTAFATPRDEPDTGPVDNSPEHRLFHQACAGCHRGADHTPPNFLRGDARQVRRALRHCAPRIYTRLAMGLQPHTTRAKTPMPPVQPVRDGAPGESALPRDRLEALLAATGALLEAEFKSKPDVEQLLRGGYENLRACLPQEAS